MGSLTIFLLIFSYSFSVVSAVSYEVTGQVPSQVSKENSEVNTSSTKTLADPVNHPVLITVSLADKNGNPLAHKLVQVTSSRGSADIIEATSKISDIRARAADDVADDMQKDYTDDNGRASFRVTSFMPGKADILVLADSIVKLSQNQIEFEALPFPMFLSIVFKLPQGKELVLMSSDYQNDYLSSYQREVVSQINPKTKIIFPFWLFVMFLVILLLILLLIGGNIVNVYRLRKVERIERKLIKAVTVDQIK